MACATTNTVFFHPELLAGWFREDRMVLSPVKPGKVVVLPMPTGPLIAQWTAIFSTVTLSITFDQSTGKPANISFILMAPRRPVISDTVTSGILAYR